MFIVYDKPTACWVEGASVVKLDLVGGQEPKPGVRTAWVPGRPDTNQVLLLVEVGRDWAVMVALAETYARCPFGAIHYDSSR